jgi:preprotein translocase subunit SecB
MSEQQPVFTIDRVYVKDMSLEIPHAPQVFLQPESPAIDIRLHNETRALDDGVFEVVLTATVTAKAQEKTVFLVEVAQAGIFQIRHFEQQALDMIVNITCPRVLLPYAREAVSSTLGRGGFPSVQLPHVDFESIYQQRLQERQQAGASPAAQGT